MLIEEFKLENWIAKFESYTKYDLTQTCIQNLTIKELEEICDCKVCLKNIRLGYGDLYGSANLKQAISNLYENKNPENITVTLGCIGANELALKTFINDSDKIVCITPCYQQIYSLPHSYSANVVLTDMEQLEQNAKNAKLICLTNPNNPFGIHFNEDEVKYIIDIARKNGAYIFADEAYRGLNHEGNLYSKSFADLYEKAIVTGSMSKAYSLAGIRLGWVVSDKNFINNVNKNRQYNTISISAIDDTVAALALNNQQKIVERNIQIIKNNKKLVDEFIKNLNYSWVKNPNSASIGCIKYNLPLKSEEFCENILKNTGILLIPASVFDCENFFRIGYGMNKTYLSEALEKFINYAVKFVHHT